MAFYGLEKSANLSNPTPVVHVFEQAAKRDAWCKRSAPGSIRCAADPTDAKKHIRAWDTLYKGHSVGVVQHTWVEV